MTRTDLSTSRRAAHRPLSSSSALLRTTLSLAISAVLSPAFAQAPTPTAEKLEPAAGAAKTDVVVVTGTRIKSASLTGTSPVSQLSAEDIALIRAVTVEDFSV